MDHDQPFYLHDMLACWARVRAYSAQLKLAALMAEPMRYDAVLRNLGLLGGAAGKVPAELREHAPGIPWKRIIDTGQDVVHDYLRIEPEMVSAAIGNMPTLQGQLLALLVTLRANPAP